MDMGFLILEYSQVLYRRFEPGVRNQSNLAIKEIITLVGSVIIGNGNFAANEYVTTQTVTFSEL